MSVLNLTAIDNAPLIRDPFDFVVVPDAIESETVDQLNVDLTDTFKTITGVGSSRAGSRGISSSSSGSRLISSSVSSDDSSEGTRQRG